MTDATPSDVKDAPKESTKASNKVESGEVQSPKPKSAHIGHAKTEVPKLPDVYYKAFEKTRVDPLAEGSRAIELMLKLEGRLGFFYDRVAGDVDPTIFELQAANYRISVRSTMDGALTRLVRNKGYIQDTFIAQRVEMICEALTDGIMIATYIKLSNVCGVDPQRLRNFSLQPKVPAPFELPKPFALAISQLGVVEISSLTTRMICVPSAGENDARSMFLVNRTWNVAAYSHAVEFAKSVGMEFGVPDLRVKMGSSWWLHTLNCDVEMATIDCPLPEDNFTESTAALRALFCTGAGADLGLDLFDLTLLGTDVYEHAIVNPHAGINLSVFFGIVEDPVAQIWKVDS